MTSIVFRITIFVHCIWSCYYVLVFDVQDVAEYMKVVSNYEGIRLNRTN